jgi:putative oxidoreductase
MDNVSLSFLDRYKSWTPYFLSLLRAVSGLLFMQHGLQKVFGMLGKEAVPLATQAGVAGVIELVGGALLILGLFTRPAAFIMSGTMAVAYFMAHAPGGFWPIVNKGELAALYAFVFLFLSAAGAGPVSLDALIGKKQNP